MLSLEKVSVNEDSVIASLVVETATLLDEDYGYADSGHDEHGDESGKLAQDYREYDESDKRDADRDCGKHKEASTDSHKLQRFL